ncbi:MAG: polyribonucleotide nucleotidyltransferase, partial [Deltaproteobacteria bacterium]|nr:polyribonucleotide nucleotidyltransferase [Deltaproteobacteria bacterium]
MANYWFKPETVTMELGGRTLTIETGRLAKQAAGACLVTYGETVVLVTVVHGKPRQGIDFFPLTVDFVEKTSAAGKIPGGFFKREARLSDREVLVCRFIDRAIRPLFADGYNDDTMVMATVLSADGQNAPDIAAFIGASAALTISEIPFLGPIAAVRVGRVDGEFVTNPTTEQIVESDMDFVVGGSRDALVMVEGGADAANEDDVLGALQYAHREVIRVIEIQNELQRVIGKPKIESPAARDRSALEQEIRTKVGSRLEVATQIKDKKERTDAIKAVEGEVRDGYASAFRSEKVAFDSLEAVDTRRDAERQLGADVKEILHDLRAEAVRNRVLETGERIDGRRTSDIRQIACELRVVPRPHGGALFTRGETQALVTTTLGGRFDAQTIDSLTERYTKTFYLHYNFPGYSTGEPRPNRGPGRREVGHGNLAERAIKSVLPSAEDFPYTIRIVSETLESNGSSSMAAICGGTLSLMDAGVPITAPVAGIAMGLITDGSRV